MSTFIAWRLAKFLVFALFCGGLFGVVVGKTRRRRVLAAYALVMPGFVGSWMLMKERGLSLGIPFVAVSLVLSASAMHMAFLCAHLPAPRAITPRLTLGCLFATIALMVIRPSEPWLIAAIVGCALLAGWAVAAALWNGTDADPSFEAHRTAVRSFRVIARLEGLSLLLMVGLSMPLRMVGFDIDGDSNIIAWAHGVLVIAYVQALFGVAGLLRWSTGRRVWGLLAGLVPVGTFAFERWAMGSSPPRDSRSI